MENLPVHARSCLAASLLACLAAVVPARAAGPVFRVTPDSVRADRTGTWRLRMRLENHSEWGLYPDTLDASLVSEDPDSSDQPRRSSLSLAVMVHTMLPASAGDVTGFDWGGRAQFERGSIVFRAVAHDPQKHRFVFTDTVHVVGSVLGDAHPPVLLDAGGRTVEMTIFGADTARTPAPAILYVPPAGTPARSLLPWALDVTRRGTTVAVVSLPGSGRSAGPADRAGPASVAAVDQALARLLREPGVDPGRVLLWGEEEGATAALLAAARRPNLAGVAAVDASFDPWASYRALPDSERTAFAREAGRDSAGWRARSPLVAAAKIAAPVFVLLSADARFSNPGPAQAFAAERARHKLAVESRFSALEPEPLYSQDITRLVLDFLDRHARGPK